MVNLSPSNNKSALNITTKKFAKEVEIVGNVSVVKAVLFNQGIQLLLILSIVSLFTLLTLPHRNLKLILPVEHHYAIFGDAFIEIIL